MGGFGKVLFEAGEKVAAKVAPSIEHDVVSIADKFFGMDSTFTGKSGERLTNSLKNKFEPEFDRQQAIHTKQAQQGQVFNHATQSFAPHPSGSPEPWTVKANANTVARKKIYGNNDELMAGYIKAVEMEHGPEKAKNVVDHLGIYFHEKAFVQDKTGGTTSQLAQNLNRNPLTRDIRFKASKYEPPEDIERFVSTAMSGALAYKAGLAHLSTNFNMAMSQSARSYLGTIDRLFGSGYKSAKAQLMATDSLGQALMEEYMQAWKFRNGAIAKYAPGSVGEFLHNNIMIPGLSFVRQRNMIHAGMQGQYVAKVSADRLVNGTIEEARKAAIDLKYLNLDPATIKANNGVLRPEDLRMATFQNAQKNVFLQTGRARSTVTSVNMPARLIGMFHNYGAMQGRFMLDVIKKEMIDKHDPVSIVKLLTTMGVIAPTVGNAIYQAELAWRGKELDNPWQHFTDREKAIYEGASLGEFMEAITHFAGFGVMTQYVRAASRRKLAESMMGAVPNALIEAGQDIAVPAYNVYKGKPTTKYEERQLGRDILHDIPSLGLGSFLAEKYLPTRAQDLANRPLTRRRISAQRAAEKRKMRRGK